MTRIAPTANLRLSVSADPNSGSENALLRLSSVQRSNSVEKLNRTIGTRWKAKRAMASRGRMKYTAQASSTMTDTTGGRAWPGLRRRAVTLAAIARPSSAATGSRSSTRP